MGRLVSEQYEDTDRFLLFEAPRAVGCSFWKGDSPGESLEPILEGSYGLTSSERL